MMVNPEPIQPLCNNAYKFFFRKLGRSSTAAVGSRSNQKELLSDFVILEIHLIFQLWGH